MKCKEAKLEIESDFLNKTNGNYSEVLRTHLMSCRKCRDHGLFLTRVQQSAMLEKIEDIPGPILKKTIAKLEEMPVPEKPRPKRPVLYWALGLGGMMFTVFLAYKGYRARHPVPTEAAAVDAAVPGQTDSLAENPLRNGLESRESPEDVPLTAEQEKRSKAQTGLKKGGSDDLDNNLSEPKLRVKKNGKDLEEDGLSCDVRAPKKGFFGRFEEKILNSFANGFKKIMGSEDAFAKNSSASDSESPGGFSKPDGNETEFPRGVPETENASVAVGGPEKNASPNPDHPSKRPQILYSVESIYALFAPSPVPASGVNVAWAAREVWA